MKFIRCFIISCLALASVAAVSCKKDKDDDETKEYLNGTLTFDVPKYLKYGDVVHIEPTGVYKSDESDTLLYCSWTNPLTNVTDTVRLESDPASKSKAFDFKVTVDSLASFTITVAVWADGYYARSATASFTIVNSTLGSGSLKGYDFLEGVSEVNDSRDGQDYYYNTVGGKDWLIQNLAWNGAGVAYDDSEAMSYIFGRYYTWDEAATACPSGWHLPSSADFSAIAGDGAAGNLMVDATFNGNTMWEFWPAVKITNSSRFSAIPVGYITVDGDKKTFIGLNNYAMFWTSDEKSGDVAVARYIYVDKPTLFAGEFGKSSIRASVRCVR